MKKPQETSSGPWKALQNEARERYAQTAERWDLARIVTTARERGINVTWDQIREHWDVRRDGGMILPGFVSAFIAAYAAKRKPKSILEGWAGMGSLLIPIVGASNPEVAIGITPRAQELGVARAMSGDAKIT